MIKTDAYGNQQWDKNFGGSGEDNLTTLMQLNDGGFLIGGYSNSEASSNKSESSKGGYDYWVVRTDHNGNTLWDKSLGGSSNDYLYCVAKNSSGGFLLGGYSCSGVAADKKEGSCGGYDYWIVNVSERGEVIWEKTFGETTHDKLFGIQNDGDGGFILSGNSFGNYPGETLGTSPKGRIRGGLHTGIRCEPISHKVLGRGPRWGHSG